MKKTVNINLGGYPFSIDEDAFQYLERYLDSIHRHFKGFEGYEEITNDIEVRLAELFQDHLKGRPIISLKDVEQTIEIMGKPEEFGAEPIGEPQSDSSSAKTEFKTGKRLFRDSDDKILGGVASGLAAYFGIQDPVWVRILFVIIFITGGFGILLYLVLWAIMPEAQTAADRLAMRGEKINISNIAHMVEKEVNEIADRVNEFGKSSKKKVKVSAPASIEGDRPYPRGFLY